VDGPRPYPWHAIDHLGRNVISAIATAREAFGTAWERRAIERALPSICGESVRIASTELRAGGRPPLPGAARIALQTPDGGSRAVLELDGALAARLVAGLLKRPRPIPDPLLPVPSSILGAAAALALEVARRLGAPLALQAVGDACTFPAASHAVSIDATVLAGDESFACRVTVEAGARPTRGAQRFDRDTLLRLGDIVLPLQVVVAVAQMPGALVRSLRAGDVLVPGQPWMIARSPAGLRGRLLLCGPANNVGLRAELLADRKIVLGEGTMSLDVEEQEAGKSLAGVTAADVLADAPLVVRIELGQVSMSARQWASLRPGDIIASGGRVADRAVLRIGGQEVARGELVDIEGELGVRIHELLDQDNGGSQ
jgi:type III secretion system YscQ/HrcQ family protein